MPARATALVEQGRRTGLLSLRLPAAPPASGPRSLPEQLVLLDPPVDVEDFARVLYARFRDADRLGLDVLVVVVPPDDDGLGAAVADRVRRAAR